VLTGFADELEVLLGHFPRGLHGLGAAAGEEHPIQVARGIVCEPLGQLDRGWRGVSPQRKERQCLSLPGGGLRKLGSSVTDLHGEQTRQAVEVAFAAVVEDRHAFTAGDDRRRDIRAVPREMQPEVVDHGVREPSATLAP
jgi:hypothetical protein